ncbi:MAG: 3'-5' exonuclease, partial [Oscillospiraceae bacterium]
NYRSTGMILNAANAVIANNAARKGKSLWTDNGDGDKIEVQTLADEKEEARHIVDCISNSIKEGERFCDNAILYRMNAQSNAIENVLARSGIPYKVIGGFRFYERKEIRDILAYLHVIDNPTDSVRLRRIINEPKRGIGETTVNRAADIASGLGISLFEVLKSAPDYPDIARSSGKIRIFTDLIDNLTELAGTLPLTQLVNEVSERSGYMAALISQGYEGADRIANVKELSSSIAMYEQENEEPSLSGFLEEIALISDIDQYDENSDAVILMTIHSAKGLEFDNVYLVGMEEGIFPGNQSIYGGVEEIEEERRLAYVAITRAKKHLFITNSYTRMLYGQTNRNHPSRFLAEIPTELCDIKVKPMPVVASGNVAFRSGGFGGAGRSNNSYSSSPDRYSTSSYIKPEEHTAQIHTVGERIRHKAFGEGMVLKSTPMGNDLLLEIAFDDVGTKKIMSNFAKLEKI